MTLKRLHLPFSFLLLLGCQGDQSDDAGTCDPGALNCECVQGQLCLDGLECKSGTCVLPGETGDGDGDGDSENGDGDGDSGDGDGDGDSGDGDGDGAPGDGDGDGDPGCEPGLTECDGACIDLTADNAHCGACNVACKVVDDLGQCVDGECGNVWSDCHDANADLAPCSEVCQNEGLTCSAGGCDGGTFLWYSQLGTCEGVDGSNGGSNAGCDYPQSQSSNYYRCCCAQ